MTTPGTTFEWNLYSLPESFQTAHDEFIAEGFRIRLMGCILEVSFEAAGTCSPDSAKVLAQKYVDALGKRLLMTPALLTEEDWLRRTTPPFQGNITISSNREDRDRLKRAIREAREELLATDDDVLRRCYGHLQDAREHMNSATNQTTVSVYKAMEELKRAFGGEGKAVRELGNQFKVVGRFANVERHVVGKFEPMPQPSASLLGRALEVIRKYEQYLLATKPTRPRNGEVES